MNRILTEDTDAVDRYRDENIPGFGPDFEHDNTVSGLVQDLNALDAPLPPQVEHTCDIFKRRFIMTADRLDSVADRMQRMVDDLRAKAQNARAASTELPEYIRQWVTTERSYIADAKFFDPIIK